MRDAIILAGFGSADDVVRAKTFDALATELAENFPAFEIRQAFTSNFMRRKLERRGVIINSPADEIARLRRDGYRKIFLLPTHLTRGEEFDGKIASCAAEDVTIIPPLLSEPVPQKIFAAIVECFPRADDEDLILVGHGSPHRHNAVYESLQRMAGEDVHIGVIEQNDTPSFADVVRRLKVRRAEKILLAPLLFNGGVHVAQDIDGDSDSWRVRLTATGYKVRVVRDGLGTFKNFRRLLIESVAEKIR